MLITVAVMLAYNRRLVQREKEADAKSRNQTNRLAITLQTGKLQLWTYKRDSRRYNSISEDGTKSHEYTPIDFAQFFDRNDFELLRAAIFNLCEDKPSDSPIQLKSCTTDDGTQRYYEVTLSVVERDKSGQVKTVLGVQHDVTEMLVRQHEVSQLLMRYHTVFNSALSDMIYYDKDGRLIAINDKACESFSINNRKSLLQSEISIKDNPLFASIDLSSPESIRTTSILDTRTQESNGYALHGASDDGKIYYEASINPVTNIDGELEGMYVSGRNVSEMVESYHRQQEGLQRLRNIHQEIQNHIRNINYALRVSDVRLVNYYPDSYTFEISNNINQTQLRLSQLRCIRLATPRFRKTVSIALNLMDHKKPHAIDRTIEIILHDKQQRPIWLMFNMVPLFDADGHVVRYFGMCRNMTELVETERQLAIETKKAQETENLKQSFLTNMSYEIRTPLNTVVGFAELFQADHDPADEPIFVEEIKQNSNKLLELVNDILFLSRLDANMVESNRSEIDFAVFFESYCQMGLANAAPGVKIVIDNDYDHLMVNIDIDAVTKMIQRTCFLSTNFTRQGSIRCKYEYWNGTLIITIEDSGKGIPADILPNIFNRFNRSSGQDTPGTGLDMPIIQALAHMLGGDIEIQSEFGKGATARITIPCEATLIEKKRNE